MVEHWRDDSCDGIATSCDAGRDLGQRRRRLAAAVLEGPYRGLASAVSCEERAVEADAELLSNRLQDGP